MKNNKKYLSDLHNDHKSWSALLDFATEELQIFNKRLQEVAVANTQSEVLVRVEHFENQFVIQRQNISDLRHEINRKEKEIAAMIAANNVATEHKTKEDETELRESMNSFLENFSDLKDEFVRFVADVL